MDIKDGTNESRTMVPKGTVTCALSLIRFFFFSASLLDLLLFLSSQFLDSSLQPPPSSPSFLCFPSVSLRFTFQSCFITKKPIRKNTLSSCLTAVATRAEATPTGKLSFSRRTILDRDFAFLVIFILSRPAAECARPRRGRPSAFQLHLGAFGLVTGLQLATSS